MAIQFDQLPDLCLRKIYSFLSIRDLVKCRAVNRQFKFYVDQTPVTELVVGDKIYPQQSENWFQTDRPIDFKNSISLNAFNSAKSSPFDLEQQLKFLCIHLENDSIYNTLNSLKQLVHLEIYSESSSSESRTLVLPNLKVLAIASNFGSSVVLKTPKLEALRCAMRQIRFEYPETIKRLDWVDVYDEDIYTIYEKDDFEDLAKLKNLEVLCVELDEGTWAYLEEIPLKNLACLKELHLTFNLPPVYASHLYYEHIQRSVLSLINEKIALQRDELKLFLNDVLLNDANQLPALNVLFDQRVQHSLVELGNWFEIVLKFMNYRLLLHDSYPEVTSVDFNLLMRLNFEISEDFFVRFPRIQSITANGSVDREQFEWFLQNATAMRTLKLTDTALDQAFVNRLPKLCSRLTRLDLYEPSGLITNFQFLLQFENLEVFETDLPLHSFDLAAAAFGKSAKLKSLFFRDGNSLVKIERSSAFRDYYTLQFFEILRNATAFNITEIFQRFGWKNLIWRQVTALYEGEKRRLLDAPEKRMRIKRAKPEPNLSPVTSRLQVTAKKMKYI